MLKPHAEWPLRVKLFLNSERIWAHSAEQSTRECRSERRRECVRDGGGDSVGGGQMDVVGVSGRREPLAHGGIADNNLMRWGDRLV